MTAAELAEWEAFYELSPFDDERGDLQAGIIASASVAPWAKHTKPKPIDFMPYVSDTHEPQQASEDEMRAAVGRFLKANQHG